MKFKTTADIKIKKSIIDQVIGQDEAVNIVKKAAKQRRHVLLIGEPGTGKCVGQDTEIITEFGPIKAKELFNQLNKDAVEIKKEDETYIIPNKKISAFSIDQNGKIVKNKILKAYKGKRKKGIKIKTKSGAEFIVSGEHPILTIRDGKMMFLPSEEINESSYIALARKIPQQYSNNLIDVKKLYSPNTIIKDNTIQFIGKNGVRSLKLTIPKIDEDLAYFLGICVAEARWQGNLVIYNQNKIIQRHIVKVLKEKFNYPGKYIIKSKNEIFLKKSRTLAHIMEKFFDFPLNPKKQSYNKIIPKQIFNFDLSIISEFISGLIDGDGYIGKRGFEITSSSKDLIEGLRILLLKFGILSRKSSSLKCATNTKLKKKNVYHRLSIFDSENLKKLNNCLNLKITYKKNGFLYFKNKEPNTNVDVIPSIGQKIYELKNKSGLTYNQLDQYHATFDKFRYGKRNISRNLANNIIKSIKNYEIQNTSQILESVNKEINELDIIIKSDIFWDKIKLMELVEDDMYDFEIENTHNMVISSGVIVHNSMLGLALAELLPKEKLVDILSFPNQNDENQPLIRNVEAGKGREITMKSKLQSMNLFKFQNIIVFILVIISLIMPWWARSYYKSDIMFAAFFLGGMMFLAAFILFLNLGKRFTKVQVPRLIVDNYKKKKCPFFDATGAHAGALLGDILHDPFQSGGLGTPAHERVVSGMIHKANMGVLFVDEIATLQPHTQQELLTALQEGKYSITGQSERSAGAMVRTEPVPCNFILIAAGNTETVKNMHPALRSRIRGYGYEVFMKETILDTQENRDKISVFVAQEIVKDKKIPHFSREAVLTILEEARRMADRKGHLTLRLRELGGLIRAAGDIAVEQKSKLVLPEHIKKAKTIARTLEQQIADKFIEQKKEYQVIITSGKRIGRVNGLAVIGTVPPFSGIILPIESQVTPGGKKSDIIATGKLGEIAKEAIQNVSAIIKKYFGEDIKEIKDIYVQFLQSYEGVEGDSASVAVATSIISAFKKIPVKQDYAMTGSLSVRGEVLPIGGVTAKVEAAIEAGIKKIIVPKANLQDIVVEKKQLKNIEIIPVEKISDVLKETLDWKGKEKILNKIKNNL